MKKFIEVRCQVKDKIVNSVIFTEHIVSINQFGTTSEIYLVNGTICKVDLTNEKVLELLMN